jgi:hypothetical protein
MGWLQVRRQNGPNPPIESADRGLVEWKRGEVELGPSEVSGARDAAAALCAKNGSSEGRTQNFEKSYFNSHSDNSTIDDTNDSRHEV